MFASTTRSRIATARARQHRRYRGRYLDLAWTCNARIPDDANVLDLCCPTSESGRALLEYLAKHQRWTTDHSCIAIAAMYQPRGHDD